MDSVATSNVSSSTKLPVAVYVLGLAVFCIGTTEVMISGLLPMLSHDLSVSIPTAGLLISGYAGGVVVGGPILTLAFLKTRRKTAAILLLALFILGQAFGGLAPSYGLLMVSRIVAALAQGALFGIGSLLAIDLAGPEAKGRALAVMFGGLTVANVAGAPFGTLIGEHWGWRGSFWAVTVLAVASLVLIARVVPHQPRPHYAGIGQELASFRNPRLWLALSITALSQAGLFSAYSYFSPVFTEAGGFSASAVPALQALFGVGCLAGTFIGGRYTDRDPTRILTLGLIALVITMVVFALAAHQHVATILALAAFGTAAFSVNPALQARVIIESPRAPTLATTTNTSAFNIGNMLGPWLGGIAINAGLGFVSTIWVGASLALSALMVALVSARAQQAT